MSEINLPILPVILPPGGYTDAWPRRTYTLLLHNNSALDRTLRIRIAKQFYTTRNWVEIAQIIDKGPRFLPLTKDLYLENAVKLLLELSYHHRERGELTEYLSLESSDSWE